MATTTYIKDIDIISGGSTTSYLIEPALYGAASTSDSGSTYTVTMPSGFTLITGATIQVKFAVTNAVNATLKVNTLDAKSIYYNNEQIAANTFKANHVYTLVYDGSKWQVVGDIDTNTQRPIGTGATDAAAGNHGHGNISNSGALSAANQAVVTDGNNKITTEDLSSSTPAASGTATAFVTGVTQNAKGKLTSITKASLPTASDSVAGITKLGATGGAATYGHTHGNINNDGTIGTANAIRAVVTNASNQITTDNFAQDSPVVPTSGTTTSLEFIDTVSQGASGKITATKKKIPNVSKDTAGLAPKGAAVSTQSQSTKFLREDGSWAAPSYTTNTNNAVTQTGNTENKEFSILLKNTNDTTDETAGVKYGKTTNKLVTVNPSTGIISAVGGNFSGNVSISGNVIFPNANILDWNGATYRQRIVITDDSTADTAVFTFQQSANNGSSYTNLFTIKDNGTVVATLFSGSGASLTSLPAGQLTGTIDAARLPTSGATAGSYGPSAAVTGSNNTTMNVPYITVDTYGRITAISNKVYTAVNTWRGIQDNLTSSANTTESLSAKQGYLLANGSARDSTKLPLAGGTMTGNITFSKPTEAGQKRGFVFSGVTDSAGLYYLEPNLSDDGRMRFIISDNDTDPIEMAWSLYRTSGNEIPGEHVVHKFNARGYYLTPIQEKSGSYNSIEISPTINNQGTIGSSSYKWQAMYATTFNGNATSADAFSSNATVTLTGDVTGTSAGSTKSWSIATTIGSGKVTNTMLAGSIANEKLSNSKVTIAGNDVSLGGSLAASTLCTSLGLSNAMHFIGKATVAITDGSTTDPTISGYTVSTDRKSGDVIIDKDTAYEYVWTIAGAWERLGGDSSYKVVQTAVTKPTAATNKWVSAIGQNANGVIDVSYTSLDTTGSWTGKITRAGISTGWNKGRDNALIWMSALNGYSPAIALKTKAGSWDIGTYDHSSYQEDLIFSYVPDTLYNGTNTTPIQIKFLENGHIVAALDGNATTATTATWATLIKPIASTTTASASTWNIPSGSYQVWGERFSDTRLKYTPSGGSESTVTDTGDWTMWLTSGGTANVATLNMRIDGTYYGSFSGNLSGTATNADTVDNLHAADFVRAYGTTNDNIDSDWGQSFKTFDPIPSGSPPAQNPNISTINIGNNFNRRKQLAILYNTNEMYLRRRVDGTWSGWSRFLHSGNYNDYAPTKTGSGASGTWGISISGNAATATKLSNTPNNTTTFLRGDNTWSNTLTGEYISTSANGFRIKQGNYGVFLRNDGSNTYILLTNSEDQAGGWNNLRPFYINNSSGMLYSSNGQTFSGGQYFTGKTWIGRSSAGTAHADILEVRSAYTDNEHWAMCIKNEYNAQATGWGTGLKIANGSEGETNKWIGIRAYAYTTYSNQTIMDFYTQGALRMRLLTDRLIPAANDTYYLGDSTYKWKNVYAITFTGNLTGNVTGNVSGSAGSVAWTNVSSRPTKITLTGAVTGSVSLGAGDLSLETTVNHGHGYISSTGQITETHQIASGDRLIVTDSTNATTADKNKLIATTITFDGSTATKALTQKGTWETFNNYSHPTSAGNKHIPSGGSTGQFLKYGDSSGTAIWSALPTASTEAAGIIQIGTGATNAAAGNHNHNATYVTAVGYDSTNKKIYYTKNGSNTDVVTFGSNAFNSTSYLPLTGGTITGTLSFAPSNSSDMNPSIFTEHSLNETTQTHLVFKTSDDMDDGFIFRNRYWNNTEDTDTLIINYNGIYINPSVLPTRDETIDLGSSSYKWRNIYGTLKGNADTATKATQDGSGNTITTYYCTLSTAQTITGTKTFTGNLQWGASGAGGYLNGSATDGGINSIRVGNDIWLGDCNSGGIMGMKAAASSTTNCGFYFYNGAGTNIGTLYSANGSYLYWNKPLYINAEEDVGLNQNGTLVIGTKGGLNLGFDNNEIMARNNSAVSTLYLNNEGGLVQIGSGGLTVAGTIAANKGRVWAYYDGESYFRARNNNTSVDVILDSAGDGSHGIWSTGWWNGSAYTASGKWLINRDTTGRTWVNGHAEAASKLYADNSPYRYQDNSPYYAHMTWNTNNDNRWYLRAYPETPKTIAVDWAYDATKAGGIRDKSNNTVITAEYSANGVSAFDWATVWSGYRLTYISKSNLMSQIRVVASGDWAINITGNAATTFKISAKLATTTKTYLLGTATTITATAANVDITGDTGVYLTTTAGELSAVRHSYNVSGTEKAYTTYNSTDNSIDFIFL